MSDDSRSADLGRLVLQRDLGGGLALIASVRDDGLDLRQFQRDVVSYLRRLLLVSAGAESGLGLTLEQVKETKGLLEGVSADDLVQALRAFGQADLRADPLSSLPLDLALAECVLSRRVEAPVRAAPEPVARRPEAPPPAPACAPMTASAPAARRKQKSPSADTPQAAGAKAEEESPPVVGVEPAAAVAETTPLEPIPPSGELAQFQARWPDVYQLARKINFKAGALLNSGCAITGLEDSTLIFGFRHNALVEKMNSGEGGAYLQALREAVQRVIGPEYDVRCVFEPQAATSRASGSAGGHLVQAARELGARVVGDKD